MAVIETKPEADAPKVRDALKVMLERELIAERLTERAGAGFSDGPARDRPGVAFSDGPVGNRSDVAFSDGPPPRQDGAA